MKPLLIFLRAIGLYLLFTLPTLIMPFMYLLSAFYAITFGWVACIIFMLSYYLLLRAKMSFQTKWTFLCLAVVFGVAVAHHLIGLFVPELHVWDMNGFLCFPGAAIAAGWVSLYISRKSVKETFEPSEDEISQLLQPQ